MSGLAWFRFFPNNWIGGTLGMPPEERSAYFDVLCLIYLHGGPIEDDPRELARVCGCSIRMWKSLREKLLKRGKIVVTADARLSNSRAEREIFEAENRSKIARKRAENRPRSNENKHLGHANQIHIEGSSSLTARELPSTPSLRSLAPSGARYAPAKQPKRKSAEQVAAEAAAVRAAMTPDQRAAADAQAAADAAGFAEFFAKVKPDDNDQHH